jgi:hypothetical protein
MIYGMKRMLAVFACAALALVCSAQDRSGLAEILSFEKQPSGTRPAGWNANPPGHIFADDNTVHGGKRSVRIERQADSAEQFSGITSRSRWTSPARPSSCAASCARKT